MPNYANITIVGHLGRDPETRQVGDHSVTNFSIAVTKKRKGKDPQTTWFDVAAWNKTGEFAQNYLKKGAVALVDGEPSAETYTDKNGQARTKFVVTANRVVGIGSREDSPKDVAPVEEEIKPAENLNEVKARLAAMQKEAEKSGEPCPF